MCSSQWGRAAFTSAAMVTVRASPPDSTRFRLAQGAARAAASAGLCEDRISRARACSLLGTALAVVTPYLCAAETVRSSVAQTGRHCFRSTAANELSCTVLCRDGVTETLNSPCDQLHDGVHIPVHLGWRDRQPSSRRQAGPQLVTACIKVCVCLLQHCVIGCDAEV